MRSRRQSIVTGNFFTALDALDHARTYMMDYQLAQDDKKHVSLWEHLGLIGKDPAGELKQAKAAFDKADYIVAGQKARSAEDGYSTASQSRSRPRAVRLRRLVVIAVIYLGATWARQSSADAESEWARDPQLLPGMWRPEGRRYVSLRTLRWTQRMRARSRSSRMAEGIVSWKREPSTWCHSTGICRIE